ncbi:MAG: FadR/GntR family transcriptional regulator [Gammaproteobacteria bacterium]
MKTKERLYIKISDNISSLINSGEFPVGSRLPTERELSQMFSVSRPTIREAIISLEVKKIVSIKAGSGVYVIGNNLSIKDFYGDISAFELLEARVILESEAAALAARMITKDEIKSLERALKSMKINNSESLNADREFHRVIALGTHNKVLVTQINDLWDLQDNLNHINQKREAVCVDEDLHSKMADHEAIYEAIKNKDPKKAKHAMQQHFSALLNAMHELTEKKVIDDAKSKSLIMRQRFIISDS